MHTYLYKYTFSHILLFIYIFILRELYRITGHEKYQTRKYTTHEPKTNCQVYLLLNS